MIIDIYRVLIIDIYRLGDVYPYLSTSMQLDECDIYRNISLFFNKVINNDEEIYIAIYPLKKFPDEPNRKTVLWKVFIDYFVLPFLLHIVIIWIEVICEKLYEMYGLFEKQISLAFFLVFLFLKSKLCTQDQINTTINCMWSTQAFPFFIFQ